LAGKLKVRARSLLATPVRSFSGAKWGVLVMDSRKPGAMDLAREPLVLLYVSALEKML